MNGYQIFVGLFAVASLAVSLLAIWRIAKTSGAKFKALWIAGSLFGFAGVATTFPTASDLYLQFGIQIPVLMWMTGSGGSILKALFPVVAGIALLKFRPSRPRELNGAVEPD
jgi:hypothetical protein